MIFLSVVSTSPAAMCQDCHPSRLCFAPLCHVSRSGRWARLRSSKAIRAFATAPQSSLSPSHLCHPRLCRFVLCGVQSPQSYTAGVRWAAPDAGLPTRGKFPRLRQHSGLCGNKKILLVTEISGTLFLWNFLGQL
ncbi:unnamed protein product [Ixodes persulcatus]